MHLDVCAQSRWIWSETHAYMHTCIYMYVHGVPSAGLLEVIRVDEVQQRLQREGRHVSHLPSMWYGQSEHTRMRPQCSKP